MVNWVRELLYLYQSSGYLLREFRVREVKDTIVRAEVGGEKIDPDRHEINQEIASIAFHKSRMEKTGNQWTAHLIFEI
jgi:SHS2 domain-containing protein